MILGLLLCWQAALAQSLPQDTATTQSKRVDIAVNLASEISDSARRLYAQARPRLLQIRIVLRDRGAQANTGSGLIVSPEGLVIANHDLISQPALEQEKCRAEFDSPDGCTGSLTPLGIDRCRGCAPQATGAA